MLEKMEDNGYECSGCCDCDTCHCGNDNDVAYREERELNLMERRLAMVSDFAETMRRNLEAASKHMGSVALPSDTKSIVDDCLAKLIFANRLAHKIVEDTLSK